MPKSRRRRPKRSTARPVSPRAGTAASLAAWGELEPWGRAMFVLQDVEARGDAAEAVGIVDAFLVGPDGETFWSVERMRELSQIADLGPLLPRWSYSRWICNQALRLMHEETRGAIGRALDRVAGHPRHQQPWLFRQQFLFELGGLDFFVRRVAGSALLARADQPDRWAKSAMGAFRFEGSTPATITWVDLTTEDRITMPNIGSAALVAPDEHVIGRLVPVEAGSMFESRPLRVPAAVAEGVSRDASRWIDLLKEADPPCSGPGPEIDPRPRESVVSDVPTSVWQLALLPPELMFGATEAPEVPSNEEVARSVLDAAAIELGRLDEPRSADEVDPWPCLGAGLLEPGVYGVLPVVVGLDDRALLLRLGELLPDPAAAMCREVVARLFAVT